MKAAIDTTTVETPVAHVFGQERFAAMRTLAVEVHATMPEAFERVATEHPILRLNAPCYFTDVPTTPITAWLLPQIEQMGEAEAAQVALLRAVQPEHTAIHYPADRPFSQWHDDYARLYRRLMTSAESLEESGYIARSRELRSTLHQALGQSYPVWIRCIVMNVLLLGALHRREEFAFLRDALDRGEEHERSSVPNH